MTDRLILGTAMWGWTIDKARCFELLDQFYLAGGREVDGATNYPINKRPEDFRLAERILLEWIQAHRVDDLKVMMKLGSVNNMRTPECNLSRSFLLFGLEECRNNFGANLDTLMIHWDNRSDSSAVEETLSALAVASKSGLRVGLSGVKHPEVYAPLAAKYPMPLRIQLKHNLLQSTFEHYAALHEKASFIAYGINAGGLKLEQDAYRKDASLKARGGEIATEPSIVPRLRSLIAGLDGSGERPAPNSMNHLAMIYALAHPGIDQILIGPSRREQLSDCLSWADYLSQFDYRDLYRELKVIADEESS